MLTQTSLQRMTFHVAEAEIESVAGYCYMATTALYLYDIVITFHEEIEVIWRHKISVASILYTLNRYLMIPIIFLPVGNAMPARDACILTGSLQCAVSTVWTASLATCIYAINGRDWKGSVCVTATGMVQIAINVYILTNSRLEVLDSHSMCCVYVGNQSPPAIRHLEVVYQVSAILRDALVLFLTWRATYHIVQKAQGSVTSAPLASLLMRDGAMHFTALLALNVVDLVLFLTVYCELTIFINIITALLFSRLVLDIRIAIDNGSRAAFTDLPSTQLSGIDWESLFFKPLDGPLDLENSYDDDEMDGLLGVTEDPVQV